MAKPALLMTGPMMPLIDERLRHRLHGAPAAGGERPRGPAQAGGARDPRHLHRRPHGREDRRRADGALSQSQDRRQLRRRLRLGRCGGGSQARRRRHQHAGRADRGGGRHHAGAAALARCASSTRPRSGCATAAGRRRATTGSPRPRCATARWASSGSAASARRSRGGSRPSGCRSAISAATSRPTSSYSYYGDLVAMARDVDTLIVVTPGGPGTQNLINAAVLGALGLARHPDQHVARLGGGRGGADRSA